MAERNLTIQASTAIKKLQERFPEPPANEETFFNTFEEVCMKCSGTPFIGFPETFPADEKGPFHQSRVHIARFYREGNLINYGAAVHDLESDSYVFTHDTDSETWPTWLGSYLKEVERMLNDLTRKHSSYKPNETRH